MPEDTQVLTHRKLRENDVSTGKRADVGDPGPEVSTCEGATHPHVGQALWGEGCLPSVSGPSSGRLSSGT